MKLTLTAGALALASLAACTGNPGPDACEKAAAGVALAEASIAAWPDPAAIPAELTDNLATAKAVLPVVCPEGAE